MVIDGEDCGGEDRDLRDEHSGSLHELIAKARRKAAEQDEDVDPTTVIIEDRVKLRYPTSGSVSADTEEAGIQASRCSPKSHSNASLDSTSTQSISSLFSLKPMAYLESICVRRYVDELEDGRHVTFYEIGLENTSNFIARRRYNDFHLFWKSIRSRTESAEVMSFPFPPKTYFFSGYSSTKNLRRQAFEDLLKLALKFEQLHSVLLEFLGIDFILEQDTVRITDGSGVDHLNVVAEHRKRSISKSMAAAKVLMRVRKGYTTAIGGSFITAEAVIQGVRVGKGFKPIRVPDGPTAGEELWVRNYSRLLKKHSADSRNLYSKILRSFMPDHVPSRAFLHSERPTRRLRLHCTGDSLVSGVGCDNFQGPVMPYIIARCLSLVYKADVSWQSHGINGGTAEQIRSLVPKIAENLKETPPTADEEVVIVLMCGLNDWKTLLTEFPRGSGPLTFKKSLRRLLMDMRMQLGQNIQVYLPAIPIGCAASDPKASYVSYLQYIFYYNV